MDANELKTRCEAIGTAARAMAQKACNETRVSISEVLKTCLEIAGSVADNLDSHERAEHYQQLQRDQEERWRAEDEKLYGHRKVGEYDPETAELFVDPKAGETVKVDDVDACPHRGTMTLDELKDLVQDAFASRPSGQGALD